MAPGHRSPFDHLPPPKPNHDHHCPEALLPFLAILLSISVIFCLTLRTIRAATEQASSHGQQHCPKDGIRGSPSNMAPVDAATAEPFVVRSARDPQGAINVRHSLLREESCCVNGGDVQQPLLSTDRHSSTFMGDDSINELAAGQVDDIHGKGSINWHGTNTLNTSWGWMA
ncbi:hypothetical protein V8C26DRAFT_387977 [Trichoderma gracile]